MQVMCDLNILAFQTDTWCSEPILRHVIGKIGRAGGFGLGTACTPSNTTENRSPQEQENRRLASHLRNWD